MGEPAKASGRAAREERERLLLLKHKYENRITTIRFGKECLDAGDYGGAIHRFTEYMSTVAEIKGIKDMYHLKVAHFDSRKDLTELLMISHVFFEMARVYDAVPKFHDDARRCLEQFVHFSVNQPYQVVNSELVRKHLKKSVFKNSEAFRNAYLQIYVQSKKCYVVTFCYGDAHPVTHSYRELKDWLLNYGWGQTLVRHYYLTSSVVVPRYEHSVVMKLLGRVIIKPMLLLFSKTVLPRIIG